MAAMSRFLPRSTPLTALVAGASFALVAPGCSLRAGNSGSAGAETRAATCPPPDTFDGALCVCEDFNHVGRLSVVPGPAGVGRVGVNGFTRFVNQTRAAGSWIAYAGFDAVSDTAIEQDLSTAADASWVGAVSVGGDLSVGGDARGVGELEVDGTLRVAGQESLLGPAEVTARGDFSPMAGPPCGCDPSTFFDVGAAVAAARTANDNAAAGLPTRLSTLGESEVQLATGSYYFEDAVTVGRTRFDITGPVSLFVDGALDAVGLESFHLEPGATLDLFVAGGVRTVGVLDAGDAADPGAFRLYLGGTDPVMLSVGQQDFEGAIYAPQATLAYVGDTRVIGSLFARQLDGVGELTIGYGGPGEVDPPSCQPPPGGGGGGEADAGPGGPGTGGGGPDAGDTGGGGTPD